MSAQSHQFNCSNLTLRFGDKVICSGMNFHFTGPGFVLIEGENGTGKSTLLKVFAGFIIADGAQLLFNDRSPQTFRPGESSFLTTTSLGLLDDLTGREHIDLISRSLNLEQQAVENYLIAFSELALFQEILKMKSSGYSQGMKQLLRLFLHLLPESQWLFLDEPFLYLSPSLREFIAKKIEERAKKGVVFVTDQKFSWTPEGKSEFIRLGLS